MKDDKKIIDKIMYDLKEFNRIDDQITLISIRFLMKRYKKIGKDILSELFTNAIDLFRTIFRKKNTSSMMKL